MISQCFPFWSVATLSRTVKALAEDGYLELLFTKDEPKLNDTPYMRLGAACANLTSVKLGKEEVKPKKQIGFHTELRSYKKQTKKEKD